MVEFKNEEQFALMREAGLIVARTLELLRGEVKDGTTTGRLDELAEDSIRSQGAVPSFKGYGGGQGAPAFPGVICASVNNEIVHGIPGDHVLRDGDIVSIDCGAIYEGWHGDSAITVACGEVDPALAELMRVTEESMWQGIAAIRAGDRLNNIGRAIQSHRITSSDPRSSAKRYSHACAPAGNSPPSAPASRPPTAFSRR